MNDDRVKGEARQVEGETQEEWGEAKEKSGDTVDALRPADGMMKGEEPFEPPLGPEDQRHPDRDVQAGETPAEYERVRATDHDTGRSDVEDDAWRTEATFDEDADTSTGGEPRSEVDDVDPIVHRGE